MPSIKKGETKEAYIKRCIPYIIEKEGATKSQAAGKCYGLWEQHKKGSKK